MERSPSFEAYFPSGLRAARRAAGRVLADEHEVDDVAAEALTRAFERWRRVSRAESVDAWVSRVAINAAIDRARRSGRSLNLAVGLTRGASERDPVTSWVLVSALRRLPRRQRDAVVLRYIADLPERDAANSLGISINSLKTHLRRGLNTLRLDADLLEARHAE